MIDVNEYLIERHLREQKAREHHNEFLEECNAYVCNCCGALYLSSVDAAECCGDEVTTVDGYKCSYCNDVSESFDEIDSHVHGFDGGDEL